MSLLDRVTITAALTALNERLAARGSRAELFLVAVRSCVSCTTHVPQRKTSTVRVRLLLEEMLDERA